MPRPKELHVYRARALPHARGKFPVTVEIKITGGNVRRAESDGQRETVVREAIEHLMPASFSIEEITPANTEEN